MFLKSIHRMDGLFYISQGFLCDFDLWYRCTAGGSSGFMVIDLKRVMNVEGIQTQGRGTHAQWVSAAEISFSTDGQRWENQGRFPLK
jgi:hypothetical protein